MQTFLPYPDSKRSAECLDRARLGKQRLECIQILRALHSGGGWSNHPAVKMWRGYEFHLCHYTDKIIDQWVSRGYKNTIPSPFSAEAREKYGLPTYMNHGAAPWWGNEAFHSSHRAALLYKYPEWYGQYNWTEEPKLEYVWPV